MGQRRGARSIPAAIALTVGGILPWSPGAAAAQEPAPPEDPPGLQVIAGHRARDVVLQADPDSLLRLYPEIRALVEPGERPFGRRHPEAPPETEQYGRLAGVWYVETKALDQGRWYCCWNALWAWKYVIDGFAVQDYWYQREEDLPPVSPLERDNSLTQLRVFDPKEGAWSVQFVTNRGSSGGPVHGSFVSREEDGVMVMRPPPPREPGAPLSRIVFHDITGEHWRWRREVSEDGGETWEARLLIEAYRVPLGPRELNPRR